MRKASALVGNARDLIASVSFQAAKINGWFKKQEPQLQPQLRCGRNKHVTTILPMHTIRLRNPSTKYFVGHNRREMEADRRGRPTQRPWHGARPLRRCVSMP